MLQDNLRNVKYPNKNMFSIQIINAYVVFLYHYQRGHIEIGRLWNRSAITYLKFIFRVYTRRENVIRELLEEHFSYFYFVKKEFYF